jgi:aspartate/methionine/tyrosine aminotransferase
MDLATLISSRASSINGSGIRRVFDEAASTPDAIRLFIGQPDFPIDESIRRAAADAIMDPVSNHNGYTLTQGTAALLAAIREHIRWDLGWTIDDERTEALVTSGTSGALFLAAMALLNPGDELVIPDPWFVLYPYLAHLAGARSVACDTYPDFRMTAERVERCITPRTKAVLICSPGNPAGVVLSQKECDDLLDLCRRRRVLLISDEIYDEFAYSESLTARSAGAPVRPRCPSPGRAPGAEEQVVVIRGFGKTYGVTGWRLGYAVGPKAVLREMRKLQQYVYVCAPAPLQAGVVAAFRVDMSGHIAAYQARRDRVLERLAPLTEVPRPGGAFYAFVKVPDRLGMSGEQFYQRAKARKVFIVPGHTFSGRDTHFRLSFATREEDLARGLEALADLMS